MPYKYRTENGYFCNELKKTDTINWCYIEDEQVEKAKNNYYILPKYSHIVRKYWDYICKNSDLDSCVYCTGDNCKYFPLAYSKSKKKLGKKDKEYVWSNKKLKKYSELYKNRYVYALYIFLINISHIAIENILKKYTNSKLTDEQIIDKLIDNFKVSYKDVFIENISHYRIFTGVNKLRTIFNKVVQIGEENEIDVELLKLIIDIVPDKYLIDFIKGAHIKLNDSGELYDKIQRLLLVYKSFSSHASMSQQFRGNIIIGDDIIHIVVGEDEQGTWLQSEGSPNPPGIDIPEMIVNILTNPYNNLADFIRHGSDFIAYKFLIKPQKNIGPFGSSHHNDDNPIFIDVHKEYNLFLKN